MTVIVSLLVSTESKETGGSFVQTARQRIAERKQLANQEQDERMEILAKLGSSVRWKSFQVNSIFRAYELGQGEIDLTKVQKS